MNVNGKISIKRGRVENIEVIVSNRRILKDNKMHLLNLIFIIFSRKTLNTKVRNKEFNIKK